MIKVFLPVFFVLLILGVNKSFSQVTSVSSKKDFFKGSTAIASVRLNTNALAFVSNDSDKSVEIICTDNNFNSKWSAKLDGYFHNAVLLGENLVVLVSTDFTLFTRFNSTFKAYLLSYKDGKVIKEKILFAGNNEYHTLPYFMVSNDHKSCTLAIRETAVKRTVKIAPGAIGALYMIKKTTDQENKIKSFNVVTFNENLELKETISPNLSAGEFIGIQRTLNNDLYIAVSDNKKGITISRYLPGKEAPVKSVTEPYSFYGGLLGTFYLSDHVKLISDTINNHVVYISGAFKNGDNFITMFNKYDFETDQHKRFKKSYTKDEVKGLEKSYVPVNKEFKKLSLAVPKQLELVDAVINQNGYSLVISDFQQTLPGDNSPPLEFSEGIIVYNLDKDLVVKTISLIPRFYKGVIRADIKTYQNKNNLYIMAGHDWNANFLISKINTLTGKAEDVSIVSPQKAGKTDYASLSMAIISDKSIILPVLDYKLFAIGKIKFDVNMYRLGW